MAPGPAILTTLAVAAAALAACSGGADEPGTTTPAPDGASSSTSSEAPESALPAARMLEDIPDARTYDARPYADWVVVDAETAWIANVGRGVARYDARTGEPLGSVGPGLDICTSMDSGYGSLWAADCPTRRLFRFDLATGRQLAAIPLPFDGIQPEGSVAAGGGGVFVVSAGGRQIARIDPATDRVVRGFPAPKGAAGVRFGAGSLWVTSPARDVVTRIDPADGTEQGRIQVGEGAYFLDVGAGAVWVLNNFDSEVVRIDPATNSVAATIDVAPTSVGGGDLAFGGGSVWARVSDALVVGIDPSTNTVFDRIGNARGSGSADADREAVWISAHDWLEVYRVPISAD